MKPLTHRGAQVDAKDHTVTCTSTAGLGRRTLPSARKTGTGRLFACAFTPES